MQDVFLVHNIFHCGSMGLITCMPLLEYGGRGFCGRHSAIDNHTRPFSRHYGEIHRRRYDKQGAGVVVLEYARDERILEREGWIAAQFYIEKSVRMNDAAEHFVE